eukprot:762693-Rhodomonas_salina.1
MHARQEVSSVSDSGPTSITFQRIPVCGERHLDEWAIVGGGVARCSPRCVKVPVRKSRRAQQCVRKATEDCHLSLL